MLVASSIDADGVATLRLDDAAHRNAMSPQMAGDLAEADEGEVAMTSADLAGHIGDAILELTARRKVVDRNHST